MSETKKALADAGTPERAEGNRPGGLSNALRKSITREEETRTAAHDAPSTTITIRACPSETAVIAAGAAEQQEAA